MAQGTTTKSTQIVPEVLAPMMQAELDKKLRFAQFADIDSTLVGQPGDTLTFPAFVYSGDATVVPEGQKIPVDVKLKFIKSVKVLILLMKLYYLVMVTLKAKQYVNTV